VSDSSSAVGNAVDNIAATEDGISLWLRLVCEMAASALAEDPWLVEGRSDTRTFDVKGRRLLISDLGWTNEDVLETRARLKGFEDDWNAPGMEAYDGL